MFKIAKLIVLILGFNLSILADYNADIFSNLYSAVANKDYELINSLLKAGTSINTKNGYGDGLGTYTYNEMSGLTPIFALAFISIFKFTKKDIDKMLPLLISNGADLHYDFLLVTVAKESQDSRSFELFKSLINYGAFKGFDYALLEFIKSGILYTNFKELFDIREKLVKEKKIEQAHDKSQLLRTAILEGRIEIINFLLDLGTNVNYIVQKETNYGPGAPYIILESWPLNTILHDIAFSYETLPDELIKKILDKVENINVKNKSGFFPLHMINVNQLNFAKALIDRGANVNVIDSHGDTPLHKAVSPRNYCWNGKFHDSVAKLLIANGANKKAQNYSGKTPLGLIEFEKELYKNNDNIYIYPGTGPECNPGRKGIYISDDVYNQYLKLLS